MSKWRFTSNYRSNREGQVVNGIQFDDKTVMVRNAHGTGCVYTFEPINLGSQTLMVKLK